MRAVDASAAPVPPNAIGRGEDASTSPLCEMYHDEYVPLPEVNETFTVRFVPLYDDTFPIM
jgi:hypothetical protein